MPDWRKRKKWERRAERWRRRHGDWTPPAEWQSNPDWPENMRKWRQHRRGHPRFLFFRFAMMFGMMALLIVGGIAGIIYLLTRLLAGGGTTAVLVWLGSCGLALVFPLLAIIIAVGAFKSIAAPLSSVMAAADTVAEGDFSVRVEENAQGDFGQLARSFNHMAAELERAEQQRRNLTADIAHELRTPLHIIQGNLEGVLDGVYEPTQEHINMTLDETRLLARLVEDLRTLSLAEAGQLPLVLELVDVSELLADVQTSFSGQTEAAGISLEKSINGQPEKLTITGDIGRLDQVLTNLVANAIRHTKEGGKIDLRADLVDGGVQIQVADNGEGIDSEDLPYIFDRFWRADRVRTHSDGAIGLGLAITRQLVRAHGGRIEAQSEKGVGTTFTIWLPKDKINPVV